MITVYGRRGFTDKVFKILKKYNIKPYYEIDFIVSPKRYYVSGKILLEITKYLPPKNLEDRQNRSPMYKEFLELAKLDPYNTYFMIYVVGKEREDERVTVEGVCVTRKYWDKLKGLNEKEIESEEDEVLRTIWKLSLYRPDEIFYKVIDGEKYVCMWWD